MVKKALILKDKGAGRVRFRRKSLACKLQKAIELLRNFFGRISLTSPPAFNYTPSEFRWRGASAILFSSHAHPQATTSVFCLSGEHFFIGSSMFHSQLVFRSSAVRFFVPKKDAFNRLR